MHADDVPGRGLSDDQPVLSVVVPLRNCAMLVDRFVSQFPTVGQLPVRIEFVLVDDASSDSSLATFRGRLLDFGVIQEFRLDHHSGPGIAREVGLRAAKAPYVTFWDADDSANPSLYLELLSTMRYSSRVIGCVGYEVIIAEDGFAAETCLPASVTTLPRELRQRAAIWRFVFERECLLASGVSFRDLRLGEDLLFLLDLAEAGKVKVEGLTKVAYSYTWAHGESTSGVSNDEGYLRLQDHLADRLAATPSTGNGVLLASWYLRVWLRRDPLARLRQLPRVAKVIYRTQPLGTWLDLIRQLRIAYMNRLK